MGDIWSLEAKKKIKNKKKIKAEVDNSSLNYIFL
mgnify:CR=1 FL=1